MTNVGRSGKVDFLCQLHAFLVQTDYDALCWVFNFKQRAVDCLMIIGSSGQL